LALSAPLLKKLLESNHFIKIFFGASSDISLVYKKFGIRIARLLDLQWYTLTLNLSSQGLDNVLRLVLGVESTQNKKRYQMYNWMKRPIEQDALEYAMNDVRYLFQLKSALETQIEQNSLQEKLKNTIHSSQPTYDYEPTPRIFRTKEFQMLKKSSQEILKALYTWRDTHSATINCSPESLLPKAKLFGLSRDPKSITHLLPKHPLSNTKISEIKEILEKYQ